MVFSTKEETDVSYLKKWPILENLKIATKNGKFTKICWKSQKLENL